MAAVAAISMAAVVPWPKRKILHPWVWPQTLEGCPLSEARAGGCVLRCDTEGLTREASGRVGAFDSVAVRQHIQEVDLKRAGGGLATQ